MDKIKWINPDIKKPLKQKNNLSKEVLLHDGYSYVIAQYDYNLNAWLWNTNLKFKEKIYWCNLPKKSNIKEKTNAELLITLPKFNNDINNASLKQFEDYFKRLEKYNVKIISKVSSGNSISFIRLKYDLTINNYYTNILESYKNVIIKIKEYQNKIL